MSRLLYVSTACALAACDGGTPKGEAAEVDAAVQATDVAVEEPAPDVDEEHSELT